MIAAYVKSGRTFEVEMAFSAEGTPEEEAQC